MAEPSEWRRPDGVSCREMLRQWPTRLLPVPNSGPHPTLLPPDLSSSLALLHRPTQPFVKGGEVVSEPDPAARPPRGGGAGVRESRRPVGEPPDKPAGSQPVLSSPPGRAA